MKRANWQILLSFLLVTAAQPLITNAQEPVDMRDYVHRSEYEALTEKFEELQKRLDRMEKRQLEMDQQVRQKETVPEPAKADETAVRAETETPPAEPEEKPGKTASLHLPTPDEITPGWIRAERWRLAEPDQVPDMDARIASVGDMDLYMAFDSVGRFQYLTQDNVVIDGKEPEGLEPGFQTPFGNVGFLAKFGDKMDVYFDLYISSRPHPDHMQGDQGYLLIRDLPEQLKGWKPLDWAFETIDLKAGAFEIDYGDAHYRRSNNAAVQANPLIGNYVVDPRATDIGFEIMGTTTPVQWLVGFGSGTYQGHFDHGGGYSVHGKVWGNVMPSLRTSFSIYHADHSGDGPGWPPGDGTAGDLFVTNRSGGPYAAVMGGGDAPGQVLLGAGQDVTASQLDLTWRRKPFEVFGYMGWMQDADINGNAPGTPKDAWLYYACEGIYNINDRLYLAGRFSGAAARYLDNLSSSGIVNRIQLGGGYWIFDTVLGKLEFVYQKYSRFQEQDGEINGVEVWRSPDFKGVIAEASFGF